MPLPENAMGVRQADSRQSARSPASSSPAIGWSVGGLFRTHCRPDGLEATFRSFKSNSGCARSDQLSTARSRAICSLKSALRSGVNVSRTRLAAGSTTSLQRCAPNSFAGNVRTLKAHHMDSDRGLVRYVMFESDGSKTIAKAAGTPYMPQSASEWTTVTVQAIESGTKSSQW